MKQEPETNSELIRIEQFLQPIGSMNISSGLAVTGYVGYCDAFNRHIIYVYTDRNYL